MPGRLHPKALQQLDPLQLQMMLSLVVMEDSRSDIVDDVVMTAGKILETKWMKPELGGPGQHGLRKEIEPPCVGAVNGQLPTLRLPLWI